MKVTLYLAILIAAVCAEPPVPSNRYLPGNGNGYRNGHGQATSRQYIPPSQQYGAPNGFSNGNGFHANDDVPSSRHAVPSEQYGAPNGFSNGNGFHANGVPSSQYGTPSEQYGAPSNSFGSQSLSSQYGAPSQKYGAPFGGNGYQAGGHGNGYNGVTGALVRSSALISQYGAPSSRYGAPNGNNGYRNGGYDDEDNTPASYQFQYDVQDAASGNDFGHTESREGDVAQGRFYVTLPDGRKQTVEYTADNEGYKPMISYEGGYQNGGYARNGNGGYSNGGYPSERHGNNGVHQNGNGYSSANGGYNY